MIKIIGDINEEQYDNFLLQLEEELEYNEDGKGFEAPIVDVVINSGGGSALSALAIHDAIKSDPRKFRVTVYGSCQSAAVIILAAGDVRRMTRNSWVMCHEDTTQADETMQVHDVEKAAAVARRFEDQWARILQEDTGTRADVWANLHKDETYLTAETCLELNLVQEIVSYRK